MRFEVKELKPSKVFVQYRDRIKPYGTVMKRLYTITHSDITADLFVFIAENFAEDQVTKDRDEVRIEWLHTEKGIILSGYVLVDDQVVQGNSFLRNKIFYEEMPVALQALRQADRFLFHRYPHLDQTPIVIKFISSYPMYHKIYNFGMIGDYK